MREGKYIIRYHDKRPARKPADPTWGIVSSQNGRPYTYKVKSFRFKREAQDYIQEKYNMYTQANEIHFYIVRHKNV
jgi:hypothetical protein